MAAAPLRRGGGAAARRGPSSIRKLKGKAAAGAHGRVIGRRFGSVRWGRGGARQFPSVFTRRGRTGTAAPPDRLSALRGDRSTMLLSLDARAPDLALLHYNYRANPLVTGPSSLEQEKASKPLHQLGRHGTLLLLSTCASSFTLDDTADSYHCTCRQPATIIISSLLLREREIRDQFISKEEQGTCLIGYSVVQ